MKKFSVVIICFWTISRLFAQNGILPQNASGESLNLDFETGTLVGWIAEGDAFAKQPIKGDTVAVRRSDMKSRHAGNFWVGTYEAGGDAPQGTLTSISFKVTQPFASFLVAGGSQENTRVELMRADTQKVIFKTSGYNSETLRPVVVDLREHLNKEIFIRLVDKESGGWGHINFDDFKFHSTRPKFNDELDAAKLAKQNELLPIDTMKFTGLSPEQAVKEMTLPPGFKATLFAAEPDVKQPIAFAIDDRGRLWVAEAFTYPNRIGKAPQRSAAVSKTSRSTPEESTASDLSKPDAEQLKDIFGGKDRVIVFEDTDGDGRFDKRTVVLENLNLVSGIEIGFGGVYIGAAPYLLFFPVTNWDEPKVSAAPQVLLDGWAYQDTHETLNTFTWGPDGWLYGCHGVFTHSNIGKPGAPDSERTRINAGVWRYHPTKHAFELFAEGTSNPWGIDFDEHGQCFIEACVIPHLFHMAQGGRFTRQAGSHFNPYTYDDIKTIADHVHYAGDKGPHAGNARSASAGGGHAHAGLMIYQGDNWPADYRGKIFIGNIHGASINMDTPERKGSGFVGRHNPNPIEFNDKWSQVINFQSGPDGAVYFIDWYDKNECHSPDANLHDRSNGRIFKISFGETKFEKVDLQIKTNHELVKLLSSKNQWYARHAQRILCERYPVWTSATGPVYSARITTMVTELNLKDLNQWLSQTLKTSRDTTHRLHAIWTLHSLHVADIAPFLNDADESIRAWSIQLLCEDKKVSEKVLKEFVRLAREDKSPVVRLYLASAMQRLPIEDRWEVVEALCSHADDVSDHNLPLMVWYAAEPLPTKDVERALLLAENAKLPILNFMVRRTAALNTPEAFAAITKTLLRVSGEGQHAAVPKISSVRDGGTPSLPKDGKTLDILNALSTALKGQRNVPMPKSWDEVEKKLGDSSNPEIRSLVQSLSLTFGSSRALIALKQTLMDKSADVASRKTALDSLLAAKDSELPSLLQKLLSDANMQGSALRSLAAFDDAKTPDAVLGIYSSLNAAHKRDALNTLASRVAYAKPLLEAIDREGQHAAVPKISSVRDGDTPSLPTSKDLTADLVRQLRNLKNPDVDALLTKVWGVARESDADKQKEIERYKQIYFAGGSTPGDALRGRIVFAKTCAQCHTLFGVGGKIGPDLTGSNRGDLDYILQNIVDPNAVIPNDYRASTIEMKDDRILTGIVKEQTDAAITVATANETLTLPRAEIAAIQQSQLSMMPEGLLTALADQEVRDLIYYLRQPAQAQLLATPETVGLFFNGKDLANWDSPAEAGSLWKVENGEIVGKTATGLKHNEFLKSQLVLGDFRLVCKVKLTPNTANSGIQFRSEPFGEYEMKGCQADIGAGWWGKLYEENGRALLAKPACDGCVKTNDWNTYEIVAVGSKVRTAINGNLCTDLDDEKIARRGITAVQVHSGGPTEVRFKDFELELNPKFELKTAK